MECDGVRWRCRDSVIGLSEGLQWIGGAERTLIQTPFPMHAPHPHHATHVHSPYSCCMLNQRHSARAFRQAHSNGAAVRVRARSNGAARARARIQTRVRQGVRQIR